MQSMITTFAHGNGPYSRTVDLGLAINAELARRREESFQIIVPLVYGERQRRIMLEDFGQVVEQSPDLILLDETYGRILNDLFFKTGHYQQNLEFLLENQPRLEQQVRDYLSGALKVRNFNGDSRTVRGKDIAFEISHNPRIATGFQMSYYTTIGLFSEILERTLEQKIPGFDPEVVRGVIGIAKKIEDDKKVHFMPEPFVFSYDAHRVKRPKEIFTPPFIHVPKGNNEDVPSGMYVMLTGIDGLRGLFDEINRFGVKVYCPPFVKDIGGADNTHAPDFVSNPNIKYQFARTGWSTVWVSHMTETPLITPRYILGDDPEIFFNERTVLGLGIASLFDGSNTPEQVLRQADSQMQNMSRVNQALVRNYGMLDGMDYTANVIVEDLLGKNISNYREVQPVLNRV